MENERQLNWGRLAELFSDPRANASFYALALNIIPRVLEAKRISQPDIQPIVSLYAGLDKDLNLLVEAYRTAPNKEVQDQLLRQIYHVNNLRNAVINYIYKTYGIDIPNQMTQQALPQTQRQIQPQQSRALPQPNVQGLPTDENRLTGLDYFRYLHGGVR